jgi:hypothetical protein
MVDASCQQVHVGAQATGYARGAATDPQAHWAAASSHRASVTPGYRWHAAVAGVGTRRTWPAALGAQHAPPPARAAGAVRVGHAVGARGVGHKGADLAWAVAEDVREAVLDVLGGGRRGLGGRRRRAEAEGVGPAVAAEVPGRPRTWWVTRTPSGWNAGVADALLDRDRVPVDDPDPLGLPYLEPVGDAVGI